MSRIKFFLLATLMSISFMSCEDDNLQNKGLNAFENAKIAPYVFYWTTQQNPALDAANGSNTFDITLDTDDSNIVSHSLFVRLVRADGTLTDQQLLKSTTSFPTTYNISGDDLAQAFGMQWSELSPNNSFKLLGSSVDADGNIVTVDNLQQWLKLEKNAYDLSGMNISIACDFDANQSAGTYEVQELTFDTFFGETTANRNIVAGPNTNQITIQGGLFPTQGGTDLILNVSPNGSATIANAGSMAFNSSSATGSDGFYGVASGNVFSCIGSINIVVDYQAPFTNNPTTFRLKKL